LITIICGFLYYSYACLRKNRIEQFTERRPLVIGFDYTWDGFNKERNIFTLICEKTGEHLRGGRRDVVGVDIGKFIPGKEEVDIYMSFGDENDKRFHSLRSGIPKVHFTGEPFEKRLTGVNLSLGFNYDTDNYFRFPLWLFYINWFRQNIAVLGDIGPVPIDRCCSTFPEEIPMKNKFCSFIVTNGNQPVRNNAFDALSTYKFIESAGKFKNNIGGKLLPRGTGSELAKVEFLKQYKFSITYENTSQAGYVTEKFLHAKAAGCIPIYWGDPNVENDFDINGCIDARGFKTHEELIEAVREVDTNDELYRQKFMTPLLDDIRRDRARATLAECGKRLWSLVIDKDELSTIPSHIGEISDS